MSSTSSTSRTRRVGRRNNMDSVAESNDLFQSEVATPMDTDNPSNSHQEPSSNLPDVAHSGLRTSDVDPGSLNYSEQSAASGFMSSMTSIRPAINVDNIAPSDMQFRTTLETSDENDSQVVVYGTDVNIAKVLEKFKKFILSYCPANTRDEPCLITGQNIDPSRPLYVQRLSDVAECGTPFMDLNLEHVKEFKSELYDQIITFPKEVIPACDAAVHAIFIEKYNSATLSRPLQLRPFNCGRNRSLRNLDPKDLDQLVTVKGLVIRLSPIIPEMMRSEFKCIVCGNVSSSVCERGRIVEPDACSRCHSKHSSQIQHNRCVFVDKQLVKLQEAPEDMPASQTPHTVNLYSYEDLVDAVQAGDRVTVTGIYRAIPIRTSNRKRNLKTVYKTYIDVLHFKLDQSDRDFEKLTSGNLDETEVSQLGDKMLSRETVAEILEISKKPDVYERLTSAIAPSIYENEDVKKGILLQMFGGSRKDFTDNSRTHFRSEVNILLCGDPGTSKSQLLQYVFHLAPRSQYTSGKGSSAVGLTAYVTKDPETRQLTLQTGALVLADNGVCCIDEFDKMSDATRSVLHEVMEQQTLSIAKAGILCQLNARTSVLAAANPVASKWDCDRTIIENIQLPHTLLSRFDLIFLILDPKDEVYDVRLARHLISLYCPKETGPGASEHDGSKVSKILKDYITYAKALYNPRLSDEAGEYLVREYVEMRRLGSGKGQVSAYPRQLESIIRLAEAHARMRLSKVVTVDDCREARRLQKEALKQAAIDPHTGTIDVNILATGVSSSMRKQREEIAAAIWAILEEKKRVVTFSYQKVLEDLRNQSQRMITRENFDDGLYALKNANKVEWAGGTIKKR